MAQIGLRDVYVALLKSDDVGKAEYEAPERIVGAMTANINPNASSATLFADDGPMDTASTLGEIELELGLADLPLATQAKLLGHNYDAATGLLSKAATDVAPWVAVGFRSLKSDGSYRYFWLTKGKFSVQEEDIETKGDSINFQTPTINGSFAKRTADDKWELTADSSNAESATIVADWFTASTLNVGTV
jgi:phi13 family phage major tail protein